MDDDWIRVASAADVPRGGTLQVDVAGEPVCLYNLEGAFYATHDMCTHEEASLADGFIEGDCIECPLHQALFHIPSGEVRAAPATRPLRVYPIKLDGADILVRAAPVEPA
ncbi:MAG TPA: non-heme iron oxygenase ferredoxin subunit [Casimicrobiaceae bacterium]|jgi:nitrite reductase/ring-hydroxylating ferredoxin subunit|nr:non-heme iron oxygenase ferredoxin subunit [Casimicrobiaceae bacterium]